MRTRRYIKDIILEAIGSEGCYARDLVGKVSEKLGKPVTVQMISNSLKMMYMGGEVRREPEKLTYSTRVFKWFRN